MSFDLLFCSPKDVRVDFDAISRWSDSIGHFTKNPNQLWYENTDTGVYFAFDFYLDPAAEPLTEDIPAGYFPAGLSFNINYNRPSFFGHEAMSIVERLASDFNLSILDLQDTPQLHVAADRQRLLQSWLTNNASAIRAMVEQGMDPPLHLELQKSMYRWRYLAKKSALQTDDIFAPGVAVVRHADSRELALAFVCTEGVPTLVPKTDWVFLVRHRKRLFRSKTAETLVVSAGEFRDLTALHLRVFESDELDLQMIPPESADRVAKLIAKHESSLNREEFEVLAPDGFVDVDVLPVVH